MSGPDNVRPRQCQTPHFLCEGTISGPNNVRPWQCQTPTMSDPTLFVGGYNIRPRQCQTPHFLCATTISGPDNVRPYTFCARLQYQAPTMPGPTLFVRDYIFFSRPNIQQFWKYWGILNWFPFRKGHSLRTTVEPQNGTWMPVRRRLAVFSILIA